MYKRKPQFWVTTKKTLSLINSSQDVSKDIAPTNKNEFCNLKQGYGVDFGQQVVELDTFESLDYTLIKGVDQEVED